MANKLYGASETAITFTDSGGDYTFTLANLGFGAGRISARADKGAGSQATLFKVRGIFQFETAPTVGETVDIYISESDGTNADGDVGTSDAALSDEDVLKNLKFVGSVSAENAAAAETFEASFVANIYERY